MSSADRLAELARRWSLDGGQADQLARLLEVLDRDPDAPTAVRGPAAVDVHVADSLSALELACLRDARSIADLGSGAGFPGAVLAVALPMAQVALVESVGRKCEFLARLCEAAEIRNARVVRARAEAWTEGVGMHDVVVARAVAPLSVLCEYAAPVLALGGTLVAWKGAVTEEEAAAGARAAAALGLEPRGVVRTAPYAGSVAHQLCLYAKREPTPAGFPRRPGLARKRPLGRAE